MKTLKMQQNMWSQKGQNEAKKKNTKRGKVTNSIAMIDQR